MRLRVAVAGVLALVALVLCAAEPAQAQLGDTCTVSVLNRNVRVNADGSWTLPNVPANFGPVRARVTCIVDGQTISGQSEPFVVPANGTVQVPPIVFGPTTPIPTTVRIDAPTPTLTEVGQTVALVVSGFYPDATTRDITTAATGTKYTISNAAIATVSADGVVQARKSGSVLVQATHEGASGMIVIRVALSNADTDGDGLPDEWEIAHGLDPGNPLDAVEDPDQDGLTNSREHQLDTDPRNADTDRDGLTDGAEVEIHFTNPLLRDTDGDGIGDGLEVQTNSNPRDPGSLNLAQALSGIRVTPGIFVLTFNTIAGDVSRALTVTGDLRDGATIDLTSTTRGTNYSSSDLTICSFSADSGRVFAGQSGVCTITATIAGFTATASGEIRTFSPIALSFVDIPGYANAAAVNGSMAYVAAGETGLQIVSVVDRSAPQIVASLDTPGNANDVKVAGTRAYVADGVSGLRIIDIADPLAPQPLGSLNTPGDARALVVAGDLVYMAAGPSGLQIIDVSTAAAPRLLATLRLPGPANALAVSGTRVLVAAGFAGVQVVDATDAAHPAITGEIALSDTAMGVAAQGTIAYAAALSGSLQVLDFSDPAAPTLVGTADPTVAGTLTGVAVADRFAAGSDIAFGNMVTIVDVLIPANPTPRATIDFRNMGEGMGVGLTMDGNFVYVVVSGESGEKGTSGFTRLYIGQYRALEDLNGIPPAASVASPLADATVVVGESIPIAVAATDDVGLAAVDIHVNGAAVFHDTTEPFEFAVTAPADATSLIIGAVATDFGNNNGVAADVRVNIVPDPLTTVVGRVLDANGQPMAGADVALQAFSMTTGADGRFVFTGALTAPRTLTVSATIRINGTQIVGTSRATPPVRGGTTDVGDIVLSSAFVSELGPRLTECSDSCDVTVPLSFEFPIGGNSYRELQVRSGGWVSFAGGDSIAVWQSNLFAIAQDPLSGVFVNSASSDHLVVTWNRMAPQGNCGECGPPQPSAPRVTVQLILFADGTIQFGYHGVQPAYATVGVTPAGASVFTQIDFSANPNVTVADGEAVNEYFDPWGNLFDLDGAIITFAAAAGGGYSLAVVPDMVLPVCSITSPAPGAVVLEGELVAVTAAASDDATVKRVRFESSSGGAAVDDATAPYGASFVMPTGVGQVSFTVTAVDGAGNVGTCSAAVTVIPDPLTTVVGRVLWAGPAGNDPQPLAGAAVSVLGRTATSGSDGTFSIDGVSTLHPLRVGATFNHATGRLTGFSALTTPERGGVTNAGDVTVTAATFETDLGTLVPGCTECFFVLPFEFPSAGALWDQVVVAGHGAVSLSRLGQYGTSMNVYSAFMQPDTADPASGVYVNNTLPGRFVVTWLRQTEWSLIFLNGPPWEIRTPNPNPITVQLTLFDDGRIQYAYRGVAGAANWGEWVGLYPAEASSSARQVDFSADPSLHAEPGEAIEEAFGFTHLVDLDNSFLVFTPADDGGYDVQYRADTFPPFCEVVNPPNGATLYAGERLLVDARVRDNMVVERVTMQSSAGGLSIDTTEAPYQKVFDVPAGINQITFDVRAWDRVGQIGSCSSTVAVITGPPPSVAVAAPVAGATVVEGSTIRVTVNAPNRVPLVRADLVVNGVPIASSTRPPFDTLLTVPSGVSALTLTVTALDAAGQTASSPPVALSIGPDLRTTVQGRVVNESAAAVDGAQAQALVRGASVEVFNFQTALSSLPNLTSSTPDLVTTVSALNLRNPAGLFGPDPFAFGTSPSRVVRVSANLQTVSAGTYGFTLGVHGGGRLIVNGVTVVDVPIGSDGLFHQQSGTIAIGAGSIPIQILAFDNGNPELQLSYTPPGDLAHVVPPDALVPDTVPWQATSGSGGVFTIPDVPTALGNVGATAIVSTPGGTLTGATALVPPVAGGITAVGDATVSAIPADPELGTKIADCNFCAVDVTLPFAVNAFGTSYRHLSVHTLGHASLTKGTTSTLLQVLSMSRTPDPDSDRSGVYVNDTLPGRLVVTWYRMLDDDGTPITSRLTVFADGRLQYSYPDVSGVSFATVGIRAPNPATFTARDFTAGPTSVAPGADVHESFNDSNHPFDLAGGFLVFTPKAGGGYDIQYVPGPM